MLCSYLLLRESFSSLVSEAKVKNKDVKKDFYLHFSSLYKYLIFKRNLMPYLMRGIITFISSFSGHPGLDPGTRAIEAKVNFSLMKNIKNERYCY